MHGVAYRFGRFVLDGGTRQLLCDGDEVHLSPKAFELLSILLASQPRAVSKADLQERLWPTTYVEETNLAGLVAEIRRALRDSATRPVFLRTVYRFGYRFVGDVETANRRAPAPARPVRSPAWSSETSRRRCCPARTSSAARPTRRPVQCARRVAPSRARSWCRRTTRRWKIWGARTGRIIGDLRITSAPASRMAMRSAWVPRVWSSESSPRSSRLTRC